MNLEEIGNVRQASGLSVHADFDVIVLFRLSVHEKLA